MAWLLGGIIALSIIIYTSLQVSNIWEKVMIFLGIGLATSFALLAHDYHLIELAHYLLTAKQPNAFYIMGLVSSGDHMGQEILHHVFEVDYIQFIPIPLATILIASLNLFEVKVEKEAKLGWFLWMVCPLIGNFGTTWALVPIGLSLVPALQRNYPKRWKYVLVTICIFSMNMLAMGTLAADPPQALWAVKAASSGGEPLGFFFPFRHYFVYIVSTLALYFVVLKRLGVKFGNISELLKIQPTSWSKLGFGIMIAASVGFAVTFLKGYEITAFLGMVCLVAAICPFIFRKHFDGHARHHTLHWGTEGVTIFIAFFSVVALAYAALHGIDMDPQAMVSPIIGLTLAADNAAAFAAGYPVYEHMEQIYMVWFNLHPSIGYGGLSPLGNGTQITLFLIILTSLGVFRANDVFVIWFKEAFVFAPYLMLWTCSAILFIDVFHVGFPIAAQVAVSLVGFFGANQGMDLLTTFRTKAENGEAWDGRNFDDYDQQPDSLGSSDEELMVEADETEEAPLFSDDNGDVNLGEDEETEAAHFPMRPRRLYDEMPEEEDDDEE